MRAIAKYAMRSPAAAVFATAGTAMLAMVLPPLMPLMVVSAALVGLATLRFGWSHGCQVVAPAAVIFAVMEFALVERLEATAFFVMACLPLVVIAQNLRQTERQGDALSLVAGLAVVFAAYLRTVLGDVEAYWRKQLEQLGELLALQGDAAFTQLLEQAPPIMHGFIVVSVCIFWICALMLARSWQSALYNPGGFGEEFRRFLIPKFMSGFAAVVSALTLWQISAGIRSSLASDALLVVVVLFAVQGLALVHFRARQRQLARAWLVGLYVAVVLIEPHVGLILAFVGIAESVVDMRRLRVKAN